MTVQVGTKYVYFFDEGEALRRPSEPNSMRNMLGGKGAGLAEMTAAGFRPFCLRSPTARLAFYSRAGGAFPEGLQDQIQMFAMRELETRTGKFRQASTIRCSSRCAAARAFRCRG